MSETASLLTTTFPHLNFEIGRVLAPQTYFKIGGPAEVYIEVTTANLNQLGELLKFVNRLGIPLTIMAGASNCVVADEGIQGLVISMQNDMCRVGEELDGMTTVHVGAGLQTALLVRKTIDAGLTGLEYFLGVPGKVGGAVYNNAHYLHHLIGEYITSVTAFTRTGDQKVFTKEECHFAYDYSIFHDTKAVIVEVTFALPAGTKEASQKLLVEATQYRATTQPLGIPSSGCIFQNVPNNPHLQELFPAMADKPLVGGGFLIDQAGLKGTKVGDIEVSHKHAAFFVNHGAGTAADVKALVAIVKKTVKEKFAVDLKEEVFYLG
jgi:UDP-N-acetylmuramate dehydrogenase